MKIPPIILAGDTVSWRDAAFADNLGQSVDSGTYSLKYAIRGPIAAGNLDLTGSSYGSGWEFTLSASLTGAMNNTGADKTWYWQAVATKSGGVVVSAGTGALLVRPNLLNLSTSSTFDGRSQAERDLAAVRTEISARASGGMTVEYTIGSRSLKKEPVAALLVLEQRLARLVARERRGEAIKNGLGNPSRVGVRFQ